MPPLFEPKPDTNPMHFLNQAANGVFDNTSLGDTAKQWGSNILDDLGIDLGQLGTREQLGFGVIGAAGTYGFGKSVSHTFNITKNISAGFSITPSGSGFSEVSACTFHVGISY
jgi:hypothetical protein